MEGVDAIAEWHDLLGPASNIDPRMCLELDAAMRTRKLTFGDRVHCPFLRPFFLSESDESRIRSAAETLAALGERVAREALTSPSLLAQLGITDAENALIRLDPGYTTASTASRLDAFLLPSSVHFAEYNAESPAGPAYAQRLCELFDALPLMAEFRRRHSLRFHRLLAPLLDALIASYREWGGSARPPNIAIVDWREVPTWSEFELLRDAFEASGVPTIVCDPRDLLFDGTGLTAQGRRIDLVYRRVLINDIIARPDECQALVDAYAARVVCVANTFRCKLAHKKAFFAVLTDPQNAALFTDAERHVIDRHVPWTRLVSEEVADKARRNRDRLVLKPNDEYGGKGVVLGWETEDAGWEQAIATALADPAGTWVVQERIPVRREVFPQFDSDGRVTMREMLVDFAPYLFRGRMAGYLTRLSATGLANVTSGGGQVPAFVVA